VNVIICNSKTMLNNSCLNMFSFIFGFIGIFFTCLNILKLSFFYINTSFYNSNLLKQHFQMTNLFIYLMKFLIITFFHLGYQTYYFIFVNIFGVLLLFNGFIKTPFDNEGLSIMYAFLSIVYELLAVLVTLDYSYGTWFG